MLHWGCHNGLRCRRVPNQFALLRRLSNYCRMLPFCWRVALEECRRHQSFYFLPTTAIRILGSRGLQGRRTVYRSNLSGRRQLRRMLALELVRHAIACHSALEWVLEPVRVLELVLELVLERGPVRVLERVLGPEQEPVLERVLERVRVALG